MMKQKKQIQSAITLFIASLVVGGYLALSDWDGTIWVYMGETRNPAAVRRVKDFSHLEGVDLQAASHKQLLMVARLLKEEGRVGVELGHFLTRGEDGQREFACQTYSRVQLTYRAEGMAESGHPPEMMIEGPCVMADDVNRMEAIWVPVQKILGEKPGDIELQFYEGDTPVSLRFEHIGLNWPRSWVLHSVRLAAGRDQGSDLRIPTQEVRELAPTVLNMTWEEPTTAPPVTQ